MADRQTEGLAAIDLDLVATSYRTLADAAAFDEMIEAWNRKLAIVEGQPDWSEKGLNGDLLAHLARLENFARRTDPPTEDPVRSIVEVSDGAAMVETPEGRVAAVNQAGTDMFGVVAGGLDRLDWLDPGSRGELAAIRRSAAENGNRRRAILRLHPAENGDCGLVEARVLSTPTSDTGYVVIRSLDLPWSDAVGAALADGFGLTDAEVEVLRLFYFSRDLVSVADARAVSLKTVRTQFKMILGKTEARSQANLLYLVSALCARAAADVGGRELDWADPFENERIITRSNGKRLAYSWTAAADGQPLLWVHGPGFNGTPPATLIDRLGAAGFRLILIHRPGHGNSERDRTLSVEEDQVTALIELAEALDLRDVLAVGTTCAVQALHLARDRASSRIGVIVGISFCWKATSREVARLPITHRTMLSLARRAPSILRSICSVSLRIIRRAGPDWYVQRAHGQYSEINRRCMRDAEVQVLLRSDTRMLLAQGIEGFVSDLELAYSDTHAAVRRSRAPTLWLMGSDDQHHQPDETKQLAESLGVELHIVPECSELVLYQRPDLVAEAILEAAKWKTRPA